MFQTKVEKIRTHILCSIFFFFENRAVNEKICNNYGRDRHAIDDNTIRRRRIALWVIKATNTHSEYAIMTVLHSNSGYVKAAEYYVYMCIAFLFAYSCGVYLMAFVRSSSDYKASNVSIIVSAINSTPRTRDQYPGSRGKR